MKKAVLITGASSGIGEAAAKLFAASGWNVVATMRRPASETELAPLGDMLIARLDVQDPESIDRAISAGIARFGRIDALVNNAGFGLSGVFESIPREKIQDQFDVNVFGVMDVTRAILPHFRRNKAGLIINVSSRGGIVGLPLISLYCASKFALEGFSESLAYELASQNIIVKIVAPAGGASTNFSRRMGKEHAQTTPLPDYAAFVASIASANAKFASQREGRQTTAEDIAKTIYGAATDGTGQLRYTVGHDIPPFIKAKKEMPDQDYIDFMRSHFLK